MEVIIGAVPLEGLEAVLTGLRIWWLSQDSFLKVKKLKGQACQVLWWTSVIPTLGRLRQEEVKFETSLSYIAMPDLKGGGGTKEGKGKKKEMKWKENRPSYPAALYTFNIVMSSSMNYQLTGDDTGIRPLDVPNCEPTIPLPKLPSLWYFTVVTNRR